MILSDNTAERAVLAGVCRFGAAAYFDVADLLDERTFTVESNAIIYTCIKKLITDDDTRTIDLASILSVASELGLGAFFSNTQELNHLSAVMKFHVMLDNVRRFGAKIRKLQIARLMYETLEETKEKYIHLNGDESISHILGLAEESIFNFSQLLNSDDDAPQKVFEDIEEHLEDLAENPVDQMGISTGFPKFDFAIGGGLRKAAISMVGARPKTGKTVMAENIGINIATRGIPVLDLDTEMLTEDHKNRGMAMMSYGTDKVSINEIETGQFAKSDYRKEKLMEVGKKNKDIPYYHKNIGGKPFEDQLSIMRRWLAKEVGLNDQGKANDCVIIYDYLKLMEATDMKSSGLQEFQLLGFMMTSLHNFAIRYQVPMLVFIQLNRDGITKESTDSASGSDRLIWLCSNFSIYKKKSDEEIASDGRQEGDRKIVPIVSRHGEGLETGDYINIKMHGAYAKLIEGRTALELQDGGEYDVEEQEADIAF